MPQKPDKSMWGQFCQALYLFGTLLAVAGQFGLVPSGVGWLGALLGLIGWASLLLMKWLSERRGK